MDIHNIDEYLDLQDQNQMNLLSTEELTTQPEEESEWHSATVATTTTNTTSLSDMLVENNPFLFNVEHGDTHHHNTEWGLLQNGLDLQGINLTQFIGNGDGILVSNPHQQGEDSNTNNNCITPDSLFKQQPIITAAEEEEKRVTRSSKAPVITKKELTSTKKKKKASKKLYCICQQPYNGKPMVQCDRCEEWFHCTCVEFDPDEQGEEDIDWVCKCCIEDPKFTPKEKQDKEKKQEAAVIDAPKEIISAPTTSTRQTRGSTRNQSKCLYEGCNNRTRVDSYCSDVCARKKKDAHTSKEEEAQQKVTRHSKMLTSALSVSTTTAIKKLSPPTIKFTIPRGSSAQKKNSPTKAKQEEDEDHKEEEEVEEEEVEEEEDNEEAGEGTETPDTPMSPSQMTEQENPVRRNVIKNISTILKSIIEQALQDDADLFDNNKQVDATSRAEKLAKSIENTMLEQLGDDTHGGGRRGRPTCGEPYKSKFRSLLYNLKDKQNQVFQLRVITGDLTPLELVKMSSEDMANPELKSKSEVLRKLGLKNSVMKLDNTPIIKKTHKGDIIMVPNKDNDTNQNMYSEQVEGIKYKDVKSRSSSPTEAIPEHKTTITSFSPTATSHGSKVDPLDDILARIGIPSLDENHKRTASFSFDATTTEYTKKRKVTLDVEELLGEEEDTPFEVDEVDTSELVQPDNENNNNDDGDQEDKEEKDVSMEQKTKLPTIWQGKVNMPQVAEFEASARQIGGRLLSETEWSEVLSPTMWIEGRIPAERVTSYVTQNQYSTSREIVLLEIECNHGGDDENQIQTLLKYLDSRQRYAVVGHNKTKVKDFYLVPLYKVQNIPDCLYVVRVEETKRECDLFLGVLVLTKHQPAPPAPTVTAAGASSANTTPSTQQHYTPPPQPSYAIPQPTLSSTFAVPTSYQQQREPQYGYGYQQQQQQQSSYRRPPPPQQQQQQHRQQQPHHRQQRNQYSSYNNNSRNSYGGGSGSSYRPSY